MIISMASAASWLLPERMEKFPISCARLFGPMSLNMLWKFVLVTGALYVLSLAVSLVVALAIPRGNSHGRERSFLDRKIAGSRAVR